MLPLCLVAPDESDGPQVADVISLMYSSATPVTHLKITPHYVQAKSLQALEHVPHLLALLL